MLFGAGNKVFVLCKAGRFLHQGTPQRSVDSFGVPHAECGLALESAISIAFSGKSVGYWHQKRTTAEK